MYLKNKIENTSGNGVPVKISTHSRTIKLPMGNKIIAKSIQEDQIDKLNKGSIFAQNESP